MKPIIHIILLLSVFFGITATAQTGKPAQIKKVVGKAQIVMDGNRECLVLKTGRNVTVKDVYGFNVQIARARVWEKNGLIFTMGTSNVPIMQDEWNALKKASVLWQSPPK